MKYILIFILVLLQLIYYLVERCFKVIGIIVLFLWDFKEPFDYSIFKEVDVFLPIGFAFYATFSSTKEYFLYFISDSKKDDSDSKKDDYPFFLN